MSNMTFEKVQEIFEENEIQYVDLKTLDLVGRLHNITLPVARFNKKIMTEGIGFDGSSYGFVKVENSDMVQIPDLDTLSFDPFRRQTASFFVTVHLTDDERTRYPHDVRYIAQKAEDSLKKTGIADKSFWGPEYEFHIFDEVKFVNNPLKVQYKIKNGDNTSRNAYHASKPRDSYAEFRDEACTILEELGIQVKYHHHEVGKEGQQEIEVMFHPLLKTGIIL